MKKNPRKEVPMDHEKQRDPIAELEMIARFMEVVREIESSNWEDVPGILEEQLRTGEPAPQAWEDVPRIREAAPSASDEDPMGRLTREFFINNWKSFTEGRLSKTRRLKVIPNQLPAPNCFRFELEVPYKSKRNSSAPVELRPGPLRGRIIYRPDLLVNSDLPVVAVLLDRDQGLLHPNYSRKHGLLCLGALPRMPIPLDILTENYLYPVLSYQNRRPSDPADREAAAYFALNPQAMEGLERVEPLY